MHTLIDFLARSIEILNIEILIVDAGASTSRARFDFSFLLRKASN